MTPARERATVLVLCVVGAAVLLLAGGQVWFRGRVAVEGLPSVPIRLTGRDVAAVVSAVGLLSLAAAAVMLLVGGLARRIVGAVVAVGAAAAIVRVLDVVAVDRDAAVARSLQSSVEGSSSITATTAFWPWVALAGAVLVLAGGVLAAWRGGRWPERSTRYEPPAATAPTAQDLPEQERADAYWKALDRGEDPTADEQDGADGDDAPSRS